MSTHSDPATHRPTPIDKEPGARLAQTLLLMDEVDRVAKGLLPIQHTVKQLTGLTPALALTLMGVTRDPAGRIDPTTDPAAVTSLADNDLITTTGSSLDDTSGGWRLTPVGQSALQQLQGLRIRIINTVVTELDNRQVDALHDALEGVSDALAALPLTTE